MLPQKPCFSFVYVIKATEMVHIKRKHKFQGPNLGQIPCNVLVQGALIYPISIIPQISTKGSGVL